jgi:hypothetical protein
VRVNWTLFGPARPLGRGEGFKLYALEGLSDAGGGVGRICMPLTPVGSVAALCRVEANCAGKSNIRQITAGQSEPWVPDALMTTSGPANRSSLVT